MKIKLVVVGKLKEKYLKDGIAEYVKRMGRMLPLEIIELADEKIPDNASEKEAEALKKREGEKILSRIQAGDQLAILAIQGKLMSSEEVADFVKKAEVYGTGNLVFVIGGSLGLSKEVYQRSDLQISFGRMTLPHQLMRLVLVEQIYRAQMINIIEEFRQYKNEENAEKQAAYLRHQFEFIGLKTPERRLLAKDFLKEKKADRQIDWELVFEFWNLPEREFQYLALDYLHQMKKWVIFDDMEKIKKLIVSKSWWDTVDALDELVGHLLLTGRKQATENDSTAYEQVKTLVKEWAQAENFWIRRIAIDCQLSFKNQTDLELLSYNIEKNLLGSSFADEFFITKAIGWALRDLAKTNSAWVIKFIEEHENKMAKLSIREASKHL